MPPAPDAALDAERLAELIRTSHEKFAGSLSPESNTTTQVMSGFTEVYREWVAALSQKPETLLELQNRYMQEQVNLWMNAMQPKAAGSPPITDKRFASAEWNELPMFRYLRDSYLLNSKMMMEAVEQSGLEAPAKQRMRFFMRQILDAAAPSNYLFTNPDALKAAMNTSGESLQEGLRNLMADAQKGHISMTDEAAFEVGVNVGVSKGAVVFENELIQLIQYKPLTQTVHELPLLMVPPCINKFYILDLQPENSLVRFAVEQGHTVFIVSWRNVKEAQGHLTWDNYVEDGVIAAMLAVRKASGTKKINALGFCVGGTLMSAAIAVLAKRGENFIESLTLLATLLDFTDVGEIRAYIDQNFVESREESLKKGGIVPGAELSGAFASLRANDLIWPYVVNNYLKGQSPPAFDLLYWNSDDTNLPGPMYCYYLRNTYLENNLVRPDKLKVNGVPVSLKRVKLPTFVFAAREDHIVPWKGAYKSSLALGGDVRFVLGASGHIAGTINPASKGKRSHWINTKLAPDADSWLAGAKEVPGSWWTPWAKWLSDHAGKQVPARRKLGAKLAKSIEPAPGRFVKERAD